MGSQSPHPQVICGQGPPPPNPLVMERFQGVVSQLFQQVGRGGAVRGARLLLVLPFILQMSVRACARAPTTHTGECGHQACHQTCHHPSYPPLPFPLSESCAWAARWTMTWPTC